MKLFTAIKWPFLILMTSIALAACGGGSSGGSSGATGLPAPDVQITSTNAETVARNAYQIADTSDYLFFKSNDKTQLEAISISSIAILLRDIVIRNTSSFSTRLAAKVDECAVFGSITSPDTTTGLGTYSFNNCIDNAGTTISGSVVVSGSGDLNGSSFSGNFTYNQLSITSSSVSQSIAINGSIAFAWNTTASIETGTVSGSFTVTIGTTSISVSGLSSSYTDNYSNGSTTETINYTVTSSAIGGTVMVATITSIFSLDSEDYPRSGQLLITGVSGSKLRLTVLGSGQSTGLVRIEVDADGDGIYEDSNDVSWATIDS